MKYIVVFLILFTGFSGVRAQDAYEQFRTEMKKLETREREYHSVIFGKNDYPEHYNCLLYTSPSPRDAHESRMPSSA